MKKIIRLTRLSFKSNVKSRDTIIVIAFLLSYFSFVFPSSSIHVMQAKEHVNLFAPFIHGLLSRDFQIIVLLGSIMMLGMQNAVEMNKVNVLMRVQKNEWIASEIVTTFLTCVFYTGMVVVLTAIFYIPVLTIKPHWGTGVDSYHFFTNILKVVDGMLERNVVFVFLQASGLFLLVTMLIGNICLLCDMLGKKRMGPMICSALIVWNLIIQAAGWIPDIFSPIGMLNGYAKNSFGYHAIYLLVLNLILINVIESVSKRNDAI